MQQLEITKILELPSTANQGTAGVIYVGDDRFMHGYGVENTFIGRNSGNLNLGGTKNTGVGFEALKNITSGDRNVAIGGGAGNLSIRAGKNTAIGVDDQVTTMVVIILLLVTKLYKEQLA